MSFSDEIYLIDKNSLIYKSAVEVRVIWLNEAILELRQPKPKYKVYLEELTSYYLDFKLMFEDPDLISLGFKPDVVEVWFRTLDFFIRKSDGKILSKKS